MSFIRKKITKEIIRGHFRSGQIGKDIYVTNSLELSDYFSVISSKLIICKQWLNVSHIAIVCRTLGVTVVQIDDIDFPLWENPFVTYDSELKTLSFSDFETIPKTHCDLASKNPMPYHSLLSSIQCQLGIINYLPHIKSVLSNISGQVEQLFLRSELLWLPLRDNPYSFLESHGEDVTTNIIFQQLEPICKLLKPRNLNLHFRGLDLRSDEDFNGMQFVQNESNPALGLHGLRQLLTHESYFAAELGAIQRLYASGYHNILYSLPFVTSSDEVNSFVCFMKRHNKVLSQFGAYIETPAAVIDIERILDYGVNSIYIGTKDLAMLTLAVDRDNEAVAHLMNLMSYPVVFQINHVIEACNARNIPSYVFSSLTDIPSLVNRVPNLLRVSVPAAEYLTEIGSLDDN